MTPMTYVRERRLERVHEDAALRLATPFYLLRLWRRGATEPGYRFRLPERLGLYPGRPPMPGAVWLHAVSLGETRAALPLVEALKDDVLIAFEVDGQPLSREHGGPARMITPQLYAWKGAKWISKIEFRVHDRKGFWEEHGYSNSAHPWREDRYS